MPNNSFTCLLVNSASTVILSIIYKFILGRHNHTQFPHCRLYYFVLFRAILATDFTIKTQHNQIYSFFLRFASFTLNKKNTAYIKTVSLFKICLTFWTVPSETSHLLLISLRDFPIFKNFVTSLYLAKISASDSMEPFTRPL